MKKRILGALMAAAILICSFVPAYAAETNNAALKTAVGTVNFKDLENNPNQSYTGIDKNGDEYTVTIEKVDSLNRASANSWKVSLTGVIINCYFYMTVTDNKCTSVYDKWIMVIGGTYDNATLSKASSYGKLEFDVTTAGIFQTTCWLKGTVTGSDNEIDVSFQM
ncbi:MAG TPA: Tat pathway signal sequence [Clostridiales bacterium]|nr:Tat pathway signal sequence [Clostridiales bacterium]